MKGAVTVSGPGEGRRYPIRYYNGDEGTALNVARSTAITLATKLKEAGTVYVRDELENVYCRVERAESGSIRVVMV